MKAVGGSPTNVAIAAARLGHRTAVYTKVGDDPFGDVALGELRAFEVDTRYATVHPGTVTPLAFAVLDPPGDPRLLFRREPPVPDFQLHPDEDDITPTMDIAREEVFGPVLSVIQANSLDHAIEIVNSSRFGNGASIFTESGAAVRRFRHQVQVGMVGVNIGVAAPVAFFPFSGWKDSFLGDLHAHGTDAVDFFTRKKTVTSRFFSSGQGSGSYFVER
jgi:hypothetical protein